MEPVGPLPRVLGIAGPATTDQERASVKQAVFLLRFHLRILDAIPPEPASDPALNPP